MRAKTKLYNQLTQAIQSIWGLEDSEGWLENENLELLFVNAGLEEARYGDLVEFESWKGRMGRVGYRMAEREMELEHRVRAMQYELSFCKKKRKGRGLEKSGFEG